MRRQISKPSVWVIAICILIAGSPVLAEGPGAAANLAQLDTLSRASAQPGPGIALARREMASGDLLGAAAVLERILINHPEADEALLLHASLLCRLDDKEGSVIEFDYLRGRDIPEKEWSEATAPCAENGGGGN